MIHGDIEMDRIIKTSLYRILEIKDSDIRLLTLQQGKSAVDKGIHIGGAFSATIPLVSLYYSGVMYYDVRNPTAEGQDLFVLSKGHAVAALASIYADLGFFPEKVLANSRSLTSILNGHPGSILPGIHTATGPLGQGICVAEGFALASSCGRNFDVFCLTGDGELQEGVLWEAVMFAGAKHLENFCVMIDKNEGQLDNVRHLSYPMNNVGDAFKSFGWRVLETDATRYETVVEALKEFKFGFRDGRPTLIICNGRKGWGGISSFMGGHKVDLPDAIADQEIAQQEERRALRVENLEALVSSISDMNEREKCKTYIAALCERVNLQASFDKTGTLQVKPGRRTVKLEKAAPRKKKVSYTQDSLPGYDIGENIAAQDVVTSAMKVFARDRKVVSVDSDLAVISGLEAGVGYVDTRRALNVGIAEANMMCVGESFAALGHNVWVSTFSPFFDWKVLRRIAVSHEERMESAGKNGWLAEGHGLDITFLATAPNLETKTNGATHMGNDDSLVYEGIAHLKIIDACCPNQLLAIIKWIMEGNRGLVYLRILRSGTPAIYDKNIAFEYGKAAIFGEEKDPDVYIVSSGRGVYEAMNAAELLKNKGINTAIVDMPSIDAATIEQLHDSGKKIVLAEQNNGYIWRNLQNVLFKKTTINTTHIIPLNLLDKTSKPRFIHSATYGQLLENYGLAPQQIAARIEKELK
ncbi:transketolase C-terminal domain-containing protein [Marispirochaeta sp.]|uniref:transketolase C-terminal domain-containing protein n=1 Tax=Marispirochaeta sp. TaxID=2038653 RepID=UPI0029C83490|nr:transketolase C-terminal domain-containing protein [Marispirochaeta sp.]